MTAQTRRDVLRLATATTAAGTLPIGFAAGQSNGTDWTVAESPTSKALNDAVGTPSGPFAAGADGNVVARCDDGWHFVVRYGPQARSRRLTGIDVTDDGAAVWFVGGSGVIGEYNIETRTLTNYSAPMGMTSTWEDCAVRGTAGENERVYFVNGSGELLVGTRQDSGAMQYEDVIKPGGGSTIPGIDFHARTAGHVCSTSQFVGETTDGGASWEQVGIDFAGGAFYDIASQGLRDANVAGGAGIVYRYDGFRWTPHVIDDGRRAIRAVDRAGDAGLAAGDGGAVYERRSAGQWDQFQTPVESTLRGAAKGDSYDVAVGDGGTIVERQLDATGDGTDETTAAANAVETFSTDGTVGAEPPSVDTVVQGEWTRADE
ncbi:hypothetical protein [Halovivax limisalsi]|uniref:hypothetical protein n=1 Tax=Halovivax limisalsi TaxID=1453760 RepID=UPI001FFD971C|nr:hypothetical protein [Halovivax limisalsi]